jgi:hypothetical protein
MAWTAIIPAGRIAARATARFGQCLRGRRGETGVADDDQRDATPLHELQDIACTHGDLQTLT